MSCKVGMRKVYAWCETCGKDWSSRNAQAVAAIHARRHKHTVGVEVLQYYCYDGTESDAAISIVTQGRRKAV